MPRNTVQKTRQLTEYEGIKVVGGVVTPTRGILDGNMNITRAETMLRRQNPSVSLTRVSHVARLYYMDFDDFYENASYTETRLD